MSVYALPAALAFAINLTLCLIVIFNNPKGVVNRVFTLMILSFVGWNAGELIMINSDLHSMALVGVKVIFAGVFLFPAFFLHFSYVFPEKMTRFFEGWRSLILYAGPVAFLIGNEGAGLPKDALAQADEVVAIPQSAGVESLNAGVAASIILYEAKRQRRTSISPRRHGEHGEDRKCGVKD